MQKQPMPIYLSQQSQFYINTSLKANSLKLRVKKRFVEISSSLYKECMQCSDDKCLKDGSDKLRDYIKTKDELQKRMDGLDMKLREQYLLCRDVIFENDIRICRVGVMNKYYQNLIKVVNQSGLNNG